jgi:hypothetical protein
MDSLNKKNQPGQSEFAFKQIAVALFLLVLSVQHCSGQSVEIRSREKAQELTHHLRSNLQQFSEVRWDVHNSRRDDGIAVIWSIDSFSTHSGKQKYLADAGLNLRILSAVPERAWQITQQSDSTNIAKGDRSATVSAVCTEYGEATLGLTVTFITSDTSVPAAGEYRTQLVGTITAP